MLQLRRAYSAAAYGRTQISSAGKALGVRTAIIPSEVGSVGRDAFTLGGNGWWVSSDRGVVLSGNGLSDVGALSANLAGLTECSATMVVLFKSLSTSGSNVEMFYELTPNAGSNNGGFALYNSGVDSIVAGVRGTAFRWDSRAARPALNAWHVITGLHSTTRTIHNTSKYCGYWLNSSNIEFSTSNDANPNAASLANSRLNIFSRNASTLPTNALLALFLLHDRVLDPAELVRLHANPFIAIERVQALPLFVGLSAAAIYTLASATYVPGSLTSTSVTPRIVRTKA